MHTPIVATLLVAATAATAAAEPITTLAFERPTHQPRSLVLASNVAAPEAAPLADAPKPREKTIFGLPKNMGPIDRVARAAIGTALLGIGIWGLSSDQHLSDTTSYVLMGVSAVPFATSATGYCPLYQLVGVDHTF